MKKPLAILLASIMTFGFAACGSTSSESTTNSPSSSQNGKTQPNSETKDSGRILSIEELDAKVDESAKSTKDSLDKQLEGLKQKVGDFNAFVANENKIQAFYDKAVSDTETAGISMREYAVQYAESVLASKDSNTDKYDAIDDLYESIYEDAGDTLYDIYDGTLDDAYDAFYDGTVKDAYDTVSYEQWSEVQSDEYERWSNAKSDVYESWTDYRSDVYDFYSDIKSEIYSGDMDRALKKISDFQEKIVKLKAEKSSQQ